MKHLKLFSLVLSVSAIAGCDSKPTFHGAILGKKYVVMQTWTVIEHNYANNEYTFIGHNTQDSPSDKGLTVKITARCAPWPDGNECPFYTGQILRVTNAVDTKADDSWNEDSFQNRMWFGQGDGPTHSAHYFEIIKEETVTK